MLPATLPPQDWREGVFCFFLGMATPFRACRGPEPAPTGRTSGYVLLDSLAPTTQAVVAIGLESGLVKVALGALKGLDTRACEIRVAGRRGCCWERLWKAGGSWRIVSSINMHSRLRPTGRFVT